MVVKRDGLAVVGGGDGGPMGGPGGPTTVGGGPGGPTFVGDGSGGAGGPAVPGGGPGDWMRTRSSLKKSALLFSLLNLDFSRP